MSHLLYLNARGSLYRGLDETPIPRRDSAPGSSMFSEMKSCSGLWFCCGSKRFNATLAPPNATPATSVMPINAPHSSTAFHSRFATLFFLSKKVFSFQVTSAS